MFGQEISQYGSPMVGRQALIGLVQWVVKRPSLAVIKQIEAIYGKSVGQCIVKRLERPPILPNAVKAKEHRRAIAPSVVV